MKIAIIGLGLIGGSMAKELKTRSLGTIEILGVDANPNHATKAASLGLVDAVVSEQHAFAEAEIIILSTPVNVIKKNINRWLDMTREHQVLIDTGSTKRHICKIAEGHTNRSRFVAAHPLAGTEFSGPDAAVMNLFLGKKNIVCEKDRSAEDALKSALRIFTFLGMQNLYLEAEEHDKHMAYVSHLSHISSFTLSLTVQEIEEDEKQIFNLASTGFESTARLAKSNAATWGPIFDANAEYLVEAIELYIKNLNRFKASIEAGKIDEASILISKANEITRVLDGITLNN